MLADFAGRAPDLRGRSLAAQQSVAALGIAVLHRHNPISPDDRDEATQGQTDEGDHMVRR